MVRFKRVFDTVRTFFSRARKSSAVGMNESKAAALLAVLKPFESRLLCASIPSVLGYKTPNNTNASTLFAPSRSDSFDFVQNTLTRQFTIMTYADRRYAAGFANVVTKGIKTTVSMNSNTNFDFVAEIDRDNAGPILGMYQAANPGTLYTVNLFWNGTQVVGAFHGGVTSTPTITVNKTFFVRVVFNNPVRQIYYSNDGLTWTLGNVLTNNSSANFTIDTVIVCGFSFNGSGFATNGTKVYAITLNVYGSSPFVVTFDLVNYTPSSNTWASVGGTNWTYDPPVGSNLQTVIVDRLKLLSDGVDDKYQSNPIVINNAAVTIFTLDNWYNIGTNKYLCGDLNDNLRLYSDGTNVKLGDSVVELSVAKPTGVAWVTAIKNGAASSIQLNEGAQSTGDAGTLMPSEIVLGGKGGTDSNNVSGCNQAFIAFDGVLTVDECAAIRAAVNQAL